MIFCKEDTVMKFSNKTYDILKWISLIVLPALGAFYAVVGDAWGLPYVEQIKTTVLALATLLGSCLGVSTMNYYSEGEGQGHD